MEGFFAMMAGGMASAINTRACADVNVLIESLAPLPPENIARIAGASLGIVGTSIPAAANNNPLCPA